ncbi:alpha/beta fold hydrolase [Brumimicrobium aurantiacum]|uniref:Alpha/beta hydrolase n=1 Tax=Brumimicrobium aurantiacum TaxID=1737063 RepID=A0A3E1EZJ9_9FLAO|nr:alpha/beta hydrolase [Brumimicrobium aurantiacum]RFC54990.1 alpha/beta hydrolase [Brumimicrobium aurantiacum]
MEKLVLIHGALGSPTEFNTIQSHFERNYEVHVYTIPHHGEFKQSTIPFEIDFLTNDLLDFLQNLGPSYIYGFSLGGYLAIAAAQKDESNILGIVTQGTKFHWTKDAAAKETKTLTVDFLAKKAEGFYNYLNQLHGDYLPELLAKTADFMTKLGENPVISSKTVEKLNIPIRFTRGGKDKMVTEEETLTIVQATPKGRYFEIPGMIHPLGFISAKHSIRHISIQLESLNYQWSTTPFGEMAYKVFGEIKSESEPVILFLHEAIGSIAQWKNFPQKLCSKLKLPGIAIEFPGYGFSESETKVRDENYLHEFALENLPAFLNSIELENPLFIIGHSDGGTNALLYSKRFPNNVKGIVTMAAHYINEKETRAGIQPAIDAWNDGKLKGLAYFHGQKTERLFFAWANTWLTPAFKDWNISNDIKNNTVPALILQGNDDQYGTDQQVHGIVELLNNAQAYFIPECGHAPHLEKQEEVIKAIENFWSGIDV